MARLNVNPTRMELRRLKNRIKTAIRGHKLLKDKSDEMIRQFMLLIRENKRLRMEVEAELQVALKAFMFARACVDQRTIDEGLMLPAVRVALETNRKNVMSVNVPEITIQQSEAKDLLPYGFAFIPSELDTAVLKLNGLLVKMVKLAEIEKACNMLADEIEKNKRRVNALEYVMIPQMQETIRYITMKLDENER